MKAQTKTWASHAYAACLVGAFTHMLKVSFIQLAGVIIKIAMIDGAGWYQNVPKCVSFKKKDNINFEMADRNSRK